MAQQLTNLSRHGMDSSPGDERLAEAIIYVAGRLDADPGSRGAVKLNKILWWADFESFRERGRSVTGAVYQKLTEGPAPLRLVPVRKALEASGAIRIEKRDLGAPSPEHVVRPQRSFDAEFDDDDLKYLERGLEKFHGWTGKTASEFSHRASAGWQTVADRQIIPYETSIVDTRPLTTGERAWGRKVAIAAGYIGE